MPAKPMQPTRDPLPAGVGQLDGRVRALREGEVMGAYIDFDRTANRTWTPAEYLVRFGEYVSQRTADVNNGERCASFCEETASEIDEGRSIAADIRAGKHWV